MFLFDVPREHREALLHAMAAVAAADGEVTPPEAVLLDAAREALALPSRPDGAFDPGALASAAGSVRERVVQAMLLMAVMDGSGSPNEARLIEATASMLGIDEPRVANLRQLAEGRVGRMWLDLTRKGYAKEEFLLAAKEEGLRGLWKTFGPILGLSSDGALADRFIEAGRLPEGTLGRAYFDFLTRHGLPFPGEPRAVAERGLWHDLTHVLGEYDTSPVDEALVVSFIAGYRREDPFFWLFTIALQFQVGLRISPFSPGVPGQIDPRAFVLHHQRGAAVRVDLSRDWNFRADWERPLAEVRRALGVPPRDGPLRGGRADAGPS
ncbi:MAG: TerB family tellurite resistance protein [Myxococcaceae bacterium]|jgi:hypothetical protein|nr:TerB family tellurite resistance protein [Myxococcaceae bacterium]